MDLTLLTTSETHLACVLYEVRARSFLLAKYNIAMPPLIEKWAKKLFLLTNNVPHTRSIFRY